ncbi:MAG TPA: hypothetical protein VNN77_02175 [candidate division Zixibacteria bacterium]|nr:hypothetical protein [candidate division Zixibacteria bacterium]
MKSGKKTEVTAVSGARLGEERAGSAFQPDVLLTEQFFENFRRTTPLDPERSLILAVLEDGIRCFQDNLLAESPKKKRLFEDAEQWLFEDRWDWVFSFVSICAVLGLDPEYIRGGLRRWQARALKKARKQARAAANQRLVA